jgi:hypothetical protein
MGQEFASISDVETLPDKTCIEYWYKKTHELLQHYAPFILSCEVQALTSQMAGIMV